MQFTNQPNPDVTIATPIIGGTAGSPFMVDTTVQGKVLQSLKVWHHERVDAIALLFSGDDEWCYFGQIKGDNRESQITLQPGEVITSVTLYKTGDEPESNLSSIHLETNRGQTLDAGTDRRAPYFVTILGSGICVGAQGRHDKEIRALGFIFFRPISRMRMYNVQYPQLEMSPPGITVEQLNKFAASNPNTPDNNVLKWIFQGLERRTRQSSWSATVGVEAYGEISVEAGIPEVASASHKFGWKVSASVTYATVNATEVQLAWNVGGVLDPGESVGLVAKVGRGEITTPYRANVEVTFTNGRQLSFEQSGLYSGVSYSEVEITALEPGDSFRRIETFVARSQASMNHQLQAKP